MYILIPLPPESKSLPANAILRKNVSCYIVGGTSPVAREVRVPALATPLELRGWSGKKVIAPKKEVLQLTGKVKVLDR